MNMEILLKICGFWVVFLPLLVLGCKENVDGNQLRAEPKDKTHANIVTNMQKEELINRIRSQWNRDISSISMDKDYPANIIKALRGQLCKLSAEEMSEVFDYTIAIRTWHKEEGDDFDETLNETLILMYLDGGNREGIIALLAAHCPRVIGMGWLEWNIVSWNTIEDPILVFVEAYRKSLTPQNKDRILAIMKQAFRGLVSTDVAPDEFIAKCERWYLDNKKNLVINEKYPYNQDVYDWQEALFSRVSPK